MDGSLFFGGGTARLVLVSNSFQLAKLQVFKRAQVCSTPSFPGLYTTCILCWKFPAVELHVNYALWSCISCDPNFRAAVFCESSYLYLNLLDGTACYW